MWTAIISHLGVDELEVANWYLIILEALSAICCGVGIVWESGDYGRDKVRIGKRLVIWGVAGETLFSLLLFWSDGRISEIQRDQIIALETRLAARTLTDSQVAEIKKKLSPFSGQVFEVIPYWQNNESLSIANRIADALTGAGWKIDEPKAYTALIGVVTGVIVFVDKGASENARHAAQELTAALSAAGIDATKDDGNNVINPNPTDKIRMSVGIKP